MSCFRRIVDVPRNLRRCGRLLPLRPSCEPMGLGTGHNPVAIAGARGENTVIAHLVGTRWRDQSGELLQEFQGLEDHVRAPVTPSMLQLVEQAAVGEA